MMYPGIERAALEIAYCNGGVNRDRTEQDVREEFRLFLGLFIQINPTYTLAVLEAIDAWLKGLSDEDLNDLCDGELEATPRIFPGIPPLTDGLLNEIFDKVG
jgi:hypothetical protein